MDRVRCGRSGRGAPAVFAMLGALAASACDSGGSPGVKRDGPENQMWYRFNFEASYQGRPIRFDQFVACGLETFEGGSFGATPSLTTRTMRPMTVGQRMADGSHVVVRIPDLCLRYRRHETQTDEIRGGRLPGWISPGPFSLLPMVLWNDRRPQTTLVEAYVSEAYYRHPEARLKDPKATVEFMPLGYRPPDAEKILQRPDEPQYDPDPRSRAEREAWKHPDPDRPEQFAAWAIVPISDLNEYAQRFGTAPFAPDPGFRHPRFARYVPPAAPAGDMPLSLQPEYLDPQFVEACLTGLKAGEPAFSNLPPDPADYHFHQTKMDLEEDREASARAKARGELRATATERRKLQAQRRAACFGRLSELRSLTLGEGALETGEAVPGSLVFRRWGGRKINEFPFLRSNGATSREGYPLLRLNGSELALDKNQMILEDRQSGQWYYLMYAQSMIVNRLDG
ncbi:MAG TPA: hypothetical protein VF605_09985 [Allosphingosinicella sp.]